MEEVTKTLLCGDLFTQGEADLPPLTESDILNRTTRHWYTGIPEAPVLPAVQRTSLYQSYVD
jgi:hypothetical protein